MEENVKSLRDEAFRVYEFITKDGHHASVAIESPVELRINKDGSHSVVDEKNMNHEIPSGFIHVYFKTKEEFEKDLKELEESKTPAKKLAKK